MYDEKNTECALFGTDECALMNSETCLGCSVGKLSQNEQARMKDALARLREAAPESTVEQLYSGDESFQIKRSKIRGVESLGMICAEVKRHGAVRL